MTGGHGESAVVGSLRRRWRAWLGLRTALLMITTAGLLALAAVLLDAALNFPQSVRVAAPWIVLLALLALAGFAGWKAFSLSATRLARLFERRDGGLGDSLTTAVQLSEVSCSDPVAECFRREAVERGNRAARTLKAWPLSRRGVLVACAALAAISLSWVVMVMVAGDVVLAVIPRFTDPRGDHPPFSRLKISVTPEGSEVIYGGQVEIRATVSGKPVDKLWLVAKSGTNEVRTGMFLAPDRSHFQTLSNLREPATYFVTDGQARSKRFSIQIRRVPEITLVEIAAEFPSYTSTAPRTNRLGNESMSFPEGTRVTVRATSNRPLKSGTLSITPVFGGAASEIPLSPKKSPHSVTGDFVLESPMALAISVVDVDGLGSPESRRGRINVTPDEKPRLFVLEPGRDAVATPAISIPVRVQATDDYGISQVLWLRGFNHSIERPFAMRLTEKNGARSVEASGVFDLGKLGVRPGDVIEYYFEAADTFPKGPNLALSRPFRLEIISVEQYESVVRQQLARQALFEPYLKLSSWLNRLAERAATLDTEAERSQTAAREQSVALAKELADLDEQIGKLLRDAMMFDLEEAFRKELVEQHAGVRDSRRKLEQALASSQLSPGALREISQQMIDLAQRQQESIAKPAQEIVAVTRLLARADVFVKMAREQALLARMLRRFSDRTTPLSRAEELALQELTHQQQRIYDALNRYLAEIPDLMAQVPADAQYDPLRNDVNQFLDAIKQAEISSDLSSAATALAEPDAMTGQALAQRAADKMDRLIARCQQTSGTGVECMVARFRPTLMQSELGTALGQILAAMGVGEQGRDGYGLFNQQVAVFGPAVPLAGQQAQGRGERGGQGMAMEALGSGNDDPGFATDSTRGRVRLQPDAKFPLRYRELVGEYFRAIAETEQEREP